MSCHACQPPLRIVASSATALPERVRGSRRRQQGPALQVHHPLALLVLSEAQDER
jgi:hypothetical protein